MGRPLDDDVLSEILSYLPAKNFFQLKTVCRSFRQLSSDPSFLQRESRHNNAVSGFLVQDYGGVQGLLLVDPAAGVPESSLARLKRKVYILASAGGLVFYTSKPDFGDVDGNLCVCNPAGWTWWPLPSLPDETLRGVQRGHVAVCFVDDRVSESYKLVCVTPNYERWNLQRCQVYDSAANAWTMDKELVFGPRNLDFEHPAVCGDTIYWSSDCFRSFRCSPYIVALDMKEECTRIIPVPAEAMIKSDDTIGVASWEKESFCFVHYSEDYSMFELWIMKKNDKSNGGSSTQWLKSHQIRACNQVQSFALSEGVLLVHGRGCDDAGLYIYRIKDGEDGEWKELTVEFGCDNIISAASAFIPYSNSLRPCGKQEGGFL